MKRKIASVNNVAVVAMVGMLFALILHFSGGDETSSAAGSGDAVTGKARTVSARLLPQLQSVLPEVSKISVQFSGVDTSRVDTSGVDTSGVDTSGVDTPEVTQITIQRDGDLWVVAEKQQYPADFARIAELLGQLSQVRIAEVKTARPENHARLGLAASGADAGILVTLSPTNESLVVGKAAAIRGTFVRFSDEPQVYLTDQTLSVSRDVMTWLDPVAMNLDAEMVQSVRIARRDAAYLEAVRNQTTGDFELLSMPESRQLRFPSVLDGLARMLVNLRFLDVAVFDPARFVDPNITTIGLTDGSEIVVSSIESAGRYFVHINAAATDKWQYEISEYHYDEITKTLEDLLLPRATDAGLADDSGETP